MKWRIVLLLLLVSRPALAEYAFNVPYMRAVVAVHKDASVDIAYVIEFKNSDLPTSQPIDVVDIGLPHDNYTLSDMRASIETYGHKHELSTIKHSSYIKTGVEIPLRFGEVSPGSSGTFRFRTRMPDMVFSDTTSDALASMQFTPTWFDGDSAYGQTLLEVFVILPNGVKPDDVLHQGVNFNSKTVEKGQTIVGWRWEQTEITGPHHVGLSFPRRVMSRVVHVSKWDLLVRWWEGNSKVRSVCGAIMLVLGSIMFFRFTAKTGCVVWGALIAALIASWYYWPIWQLIALLLWIPLLIFMEWRLRHGRHKYLPPIVHVEGGGIKRGLTAPEAAILIERPLGQVLALTLFGMLKKKLIVLTGPNLKAVTVAPAYAKQSRKQRRKTAAKAGTVIHKYEDVFLDFISDNVVINSTTMSEPLRALIERTVERVDGFDLEATKAYYVQIVARAWTEAESINVGDKQRNERIDRQIDWLMADSKWDERSRQYLVGYHPNWAWYGDPTSSVAASTGLGSGGAAGSTHVPSIGDVTSSFAGWAETQAGQFADAVIPPTLNLETGFNGAIDLSGADRVTFEVFDALLSAGGSGGSSGGGGSGGCACACAGCACACACAGGGR